MDHDQSRPARNTGEASGEHVDHVDPGTIARQLFETAIDMRGDADADLFLARVVSELFELSPIVTEAIFDLVLVELVEDLHRHGRAGKDAAKMVSQVQRDWSTNA